MNETDNVNENVESKENTSFGGGIGNSNKSVFAQVFAKSRDQKEREMVTKLLAQGISEEQICKVLRISEERLNEIKNAK